MAEDPELWKACEDFPGYLVSNHGRVIGKHKRMLKFDVRKGYHTVTFFKENAGKHFDVHRLVGMAFIENPDNKKFIDHIDGNRQNNHWTNLRWCTSKENCANRGPNKKCKTGMKGVRVCGNRFGAAIVIDGKSQWLGVFDTKEEASAAYFAVAKAIHGEFARVI